MLGEREIIDGKAGKYVWLTYKEVYDSVLNVGESICSRGIEKVSLGPLMFASMFLLVGDHYQLPPLVQQVVKRHWLSLVLKTNRIELQECNIEDGINRNEDAIMLLLKLKLDFHIEWLFTQEAKVRLKALDDLCGEFHVQCKGPCEALI
ncbi:hypothetical protein L1887_28838 [Cichorium endivia]|nr:hypothetical protein L1887_28838 [Cichorium endivia]